jgi:hypothetical protein
MAAGRDGFLLTEREEREGRERQKRRRGDSSSRLRPNRCDTTHGTYLAARLSSRIHTYIHTVYNSLNHVSTAVRLRSVLSPAADSHAAVAPRAKKYRPVTTSPNIHRRSPPGSPQAGRADLLVPPNHPPRRVALSNCPSANSASQVPFPVTCLGLGSDRPIVASLWKLSTATTHYCLAGLAIDR